MPQWFFLFLYTYCTFILFIVCMYQYIYQITLKTFPHASVILHHLQIKWFRYRPVVGQRVGTGIALLFHDRGTRRGCVVSSTPRPHFSREEDLVPILQEAGWAPGPVWTGGKSRLHRDSIRTVQPVVIRYTDWATRPTSMNIAFAKVIKYWYNYIQQHIVI